MLDLGKQGPFRSFLKLSFILHDLPHQMKRQDDDQLRHFKDLKVL